MKPGFVPNPDTPEFNYDKTYENNESWKPAAMSREAEISALRKAGVRLQAENLPLPPSFDAAARALTSHFRRRAISTLGTDKFRKLTFAEVLMKLHWDTSPGWYWSNLGFKTKGDVIADPKMLSYLEAVYNETESIDPVFTGSLKSELRPESRVQQNKTRLFQIAPIEHHILLYKYFGVFLDWFSANFNDITCVGESPFGGNWDLMIRDLKTHPDGYSLDGSSYDYHINEHFYDKTLRILKAFCATSPGCDKLFLDTAFAPFIDSLGNVIATCGTNKSGFLLTLFLNTIALILSKLALWIEMNGDSPDSIKAFWEHVKFRVVGDDNIFTRSPEAAAFYTAENFIKFMSPWIPFEPAYPEARPADKMSFLSKATAYDEVYHKYVPTWAFARVYSTVLYDKVALGGPNLYDRCMKLFNLRILSFYDKQAFPQLDLYCAKILKSLDSRFRGTADYKTLYDLYWTEDEIREFFCVPEPHRKLRIGVTEEFLQFASDLPEEETYVVSSHLTNQAQGWDKPKTPPEFRMDIILPAYIHLMGVIPCRCKPNCIVSNHYEFEIVSTYQNGTEGRFFGWELRNIFHDLSQWRPRYGTLEVFPHWNHAQSKTLTRVDTHEKIFEGRKSVTEVLPLQASLLHPGFSSHQSTNRTDMSKREKVAAGKRAVQAAVKAAVAGSFPAAGKKVRSKPAGKPKVTVVVQKAANKRPPATTGVPAAAVKAAVRHEQATAAAERRFNKDAAAVAAAILNPLGHQPQRNPYFSTKPTAVCKLHEDSDVAFADDDASGGVQPFLMNRNNQAIFMYNYPQLWYRDIQFVSQVTEYQWQFGDPSNPGQYTPDLTLLIAGQTPNVVQTSFAGPTVDSSQVHDAVQYCGNVGGVPCVFIAKGDSPNGIVGRGTVELVFQNLVDGTPVGIQLWKFKNKEWNQYAKILNSTGGEATVVIDDTAHYTFTFDENDIYSGLHVKTRWTPLVAGKPMSTIGQHSVPEFEEHAPNMDSVTVTATDILWTNVSANEFKQGEMHMIQVEGTHEIGEFFPSDPTVSMSKYIGGLNETKFMPADKGCHGPRIPNGVKDFQETDLGGMVSTNYAVPPYDLDNPTDFVVIIMTIPSDAANSRAFHQVLCCHLEFRTTSMVYQLGVCPYDTDVVDKVIQQLRKSGIQFTANENHISRIFAFLKNRFLPAASGAATALAPMFGAYGPAIRAAGMLGGAISQL